MLALVVVIVVMMIVNLFIGSVEIPVGDICRILVGQGSESEIWTNIILSSRLPQVLTAIVAGAGLAVSGLMMQTIFHNPMAGPSILGISNGASLGVAFVVLLSGQLGGVALSSLGYLGDAAVSVAAIIGAIAVMMLIVWISGKVKGNVTLLIIGVMIGYLATAIIGVLKFLSPEEDVKAFVVWGLGSFSRVSGDQMILFVVLMCILLPLSFLLVKPAGKALECHAAGRPLCRQLGRQCQACPHMDHHLFRHTRRYCHRLLRPHHVHRYGRAPFGPWNLPYQRPLETDARYRPVWRSLSANL